MPRLERGEPVILWDLKQGTPEWHATRCGIPSASNFAKIMTGTELKKTRSWPAYCRELCGALLGGEPEFTGNAATRRGQELEPQARDWYQFERGETVTECGFAFFDDRRAFGCSPDGLVGDAGAVEIKCPGISTHVEYLLNPKKIPAKYISQVRGQLFVLDREWIDFVSYYPGVNPVLVRVHRDDPDQLNWEAAFEELIVQFLGQLANMKKKLGIV
jgi:putative phage-type endonuclease